MSIRYYIGRWRVPRWLFEVTPDWLHRMADLSISIPERLRRKEAR